MSQLELMCIQVFLSRLQHFIALLLAQTTNIYFIKSHFILCAKSIIRKSCIYLHILMIILSKRKRYHICLTNSDLLNIGFHIVARVIQSKKLWFNYRIKLVSLVSQAESRFSRKDLEYYDSSSRNSTYAFSLHANCIPERKAYLNDKMLIKYESKSQVQIFSDVKFKSAKAALGFNVVHQYCLKQLPIDLQRKTV